MINISVLDVTPCSLVNEHEHFRGSCCLNFQGAKCYTEDGGIRFFRNIGSLPNYGAVIFLVYTVIPFDFTYVTVVFDRD